MYVLFADTDMDITPKEAEEFGYNLISMPFTIDGKEIYPYEGGKDFDMKSFYDSLRNGAVPKTSGLSPEMYVDYFEPFFKEGKDVLYVHFSSAMSGTFNSMRIAEQELKEKYPERKLYSIDTRSISVGSLNILKEIGTLYKKGLSAEDIIKWSETEIDKFAVYFFADNLSFFRRSGRVNNLAAVFGNLLGIKPIIHIGSDGVMTSIDKVRGVKATITKILDYVKILQQDIKSHRVIIAHSDNIELASVLANKLKEEFGEDLNVETTYVNPTAGCHCGPDCVGVSFYAKHR